MWIKKLMTIEINCEPIYVDDWEEIVDNKN